MPADKNPRVIPAPPSSLPGAFGQPVPLPQMYMATPATDTNAKASEKRPTAKVPHPAKPPGMAHHRQKVKQGKAAVVIKPRAERKKGR